MNENRKKKIGYYMNGIGIGGNGRYLWDLIQHLDRTRYDIVVYLKCPPSEERGQFISKVTALNVQLRNLDEEGLPYKERTSRNHEDRKPIAPKGAKSLAVFLKQIILRLTPGLLKVFLYYFKIVSRVGKAFAEEQLDIIHFSLGIFPEHLLIFLGAKKAKIPVRIATIHSVDERNVFGRRLSAKVIMALAVRSFSAVITLSQNMKSRLSKRFGFEPAKVRVIPNGIFVEENKEDEDENGVEMRRALEIEPDCRVFLVPARLSQEKGHEILIEAIKGMNLKPSEAVFLMAGEGPLEDELKEKAKKAGIAKAIKFLGFRKDISKILSVSDVVLLPSLNEGLPFALLEAMAAAKAVIATKVGGVPEMVLANQTGKLVEPGNPESLGEAIRDILNMERTELITMGSKGKENVEKFYSIESMIKNTFQLYGESETPFAAWKDQKRSGILVAPNLR